MYMGEHQAMNNTKRWSALGLMTHLKLKQRRSIALRCHIISIFHVPESFGRARPVVLTDSLHFKHVSLVI